MACDSVWGHILNRNLQLLFNLQNLFFLNFLPKNGHNFKVFNKECWSDYDFRRIELNFIEPDF